MGELLQYEFIRNALLAGILISFACGVMGSLVVVNRMVFISGGVAHAAYGGIGLAIFLGIPPLLGASIFSLVVAFLIGLLTLRNRSRTDTVIGVLWAAGMSFGIILTDLSRGYRVDLMSYLFGSILAVPRIDLWAALILDGFILVFVIVFYRDLLAMSFDPEFASLRGVRVTFLHFALLVITALTVVLTIRLVGLILVIALLTIPIYIAEEFADSLGRTMLYSFFGSLIFTIAGLWVSYSWNLTSGASIILVATVAFFALFAVKYIRVLRKRFRAKSPVRKVEPTAV
jgi:zinc transport system permease protein